MAERRKNRKRKDEIAHPEAEEVLEKPSKEEYAVAKWIRSNVPSKKTKFLNHNVQYFTGTRAVDALLEKSPWNKTLFETREQITSFLDSMLKHKFFHRAKKVVLSEQELSKIRGAKKKGKDNGKPESKEDKKSLEKDEGKEKDAADPKDNDDKQEEKKELKKKPKVRLEMHLDQYFADSNDAYVWIYDPIPVYYWLIGTLVVLGTIGVCLFPLWPPSIRQGVYYISVTAAGFLVFILALAVIRVIVFCLLWVLTLGRHHLWLLPNLAEDVGFFASFWPLYQYEYCGPSSDGDKKSSKKKKRKKDKDSDSEETPLAPGESPATEDEGNDAKSGEEEEEAIENLGRNGDGERDGEEEVSEEGSESEKSNTGRDFEMVQHTELEEK
ncbi:translocation protein SEC62 [Neodiprion pinetum]|uniref:Translocation protein SEC62 n=1 Tax=Neodiprion lecontei TaxID=441921 RepID=A0A6J0BKF1_NEOLC|nr:translocation protein SEC62 [Neodiprion lecontei]XP_046427716.1 translocation protein SEC62 [Neodiprion fabricii]XP_046484633.1 translocation protein SEC62 [Neodiprion pinetum]XP_046620296.1 translocation protein SEC62 [Neodiprion virginianus]